ncbi:MAG: hypothetical protein R3346_02405 [Candidatus Spechtbacterales bacterium]|nr:hypothetical protein [Candidatus Spechtbacterales bacterium]
MPSLIPYKKKRSTPLSKAKDFLIEHKEFAPSLVLVIVFLITYGALAIWHNQLNGTLEEIENESRTIISGRKLSQIENIENFAEQTRVLGGIIDEQIRVSKLFPEFEKSIHRQTQIKSLRLDVDNRALEVSGITGSLEILGQQFLVWRNESLYINDVELSSFLRTENGEVEFSAKLEINSDYIK